MGVDLETTYTKTFFANQSSIASGLHLQPGVDANLAKLIEAKVIVDESLISQLNKDVNNRGELVVKNIIARHSLDVYEKFLAVWHSFNPSAANNFELKLNNALERWDMKRHRPTMALPVAANLNPVDHQPPPVNHGISPAVTNLDPANYQPLPTDPTGFKWSESWQYAMNKKRVKLMRSFQFEPSMFDKLREKDVITDEQHVRITAELQPYEKARTMYDALKRREPETIRLFIDILRDNGHRVLLEEVQDSYDLAMQAAAAAMD